MAASNDPGWSIGTWLFAGLGTAAIYTVVVLCMYGPQEDPAKLNGMFAPLTAVATAATFAMLVRQAIINHNDQKRSSEKQMALTQMQTAGIRLLSLEGSNRDAARRELELMLEAYERKYRD